MISIIIPILNEADFLSATLSHVQANSIKHEMVLVDGGSTDATLEIAKSAGAHVVISPQCQRAAQMNLGAQHAHGEIFLFLHADTLLAPTALEQIEKVLADPRVVGGAFVRRYDSSSLFLQATCYLAELRSRWFGWQLGDQAMFVRAESFVQLGGFRDMDLFEDLDFSRRLNRLGKIITLKPPIISSARRFKKRGIFTTTLSDFLLTLRYMLGEDPHKLAATLQKKSS